MATSPRRAGGRTLITQDPGKLKWILSARESADRPEQLENQLTDLRAFVAGIGGTVVREVPENAVSSFKKKRILLPDGTYGYRVIRPDWEAILTTLRRRECNALAVADIDRATRDPRLLEDLIEVVEHYGAYIVSLTGNIDLTTDAGISAARGLVNQRNQESRNTARRVTDGKRKAALKGRNSGGPYRAFGWRKDRIHVNKREAAHIRREIPRIIAGGLTPLTLAQEWERRGIPTVTGLKKWRQNTILGIFTNPRLCGLRTYRGEILRDENNEPTKGIWEPIITVEEYEAIVSRWVPREYDRAARLGAKGTGYRTKYLLSPFVRCGACNARMLGTVRPTPSKRRKVEIYRCPARGMGGCGRVARRAEEINEYVTTLVIMEHQKISARRASVTEELPPWPKAGELRALQRRIAESTEMYEKGEYSKERYFPSLTRMEAQEAVLKKEKRAHEARQQSRRITPIDLAQRWNDPEFTMEEKQAAIAKTLEAVIILPSHKGARFHPDLIVPVWREETE
jgi:DNA invertase Pin-like site-specific DNA recombinase